MRRFLLMLAVVLFAMTAFAAIAPGLYRVNVNSTLNVRNAPGGAKIGSLTVARAMCMNNTLSLSPLWLLRLEHLTPQSVFPNSGIIPLLPYCCLPSLPSSDYVQIPDRCSTQVAFYGAGLNCSCSELGVTAHSSGSATLRM